ncbi:BFH_collapsed_G0021050.mRNA.1.CDS.1 [Saccharomyces cerevisiae]|nr:BFH_collapsed_G0021050.mRNA.1.CDS.1 [Saccharomyces cerevisiae]
MDDPFMVAEYTDSIFSHLYAQLTSCLMRCRHIAFLLYSTLCPYHLKSSMRALLIDWLVEVHEKFHCLPETLFVVTLDIGNYKYCFVSCFFIGCKFEEVKLPKITNFAYVTDGAAIFRRNLGSFCAIGSRARIV